MFSFRYFCTSSDNRLPRRAERDGMGWASDWAGAGTETGAGAGLVWGGHQTRVRKKSRKQTERRVGLAGGTGEVQSGEEACQLYRQTVGLTEFQFSSFSSSLLLLLLLSCFYCHRIIEAASKVESRQRRRRRRRHKSNSHRRSWHLLRAALTAAPRGGRRTDLRFLMLSISLEDATAKRRKSDECDANVASTSKGRTNCKDNKDQSG